jgi:hypothetical protein
MAYLTIDGESTNGGNARGPSTISGYCEYILIDVIYQLPRIWVGHIDTYLRVVIEGTILTRASRF